MQFFSYHIACREDSVASKESQAFIIKAHTLTQYWTQTLSIPWGDAIFQVPESYITAWSWKQLLNFLINKKIS